MAAINEPPDLLLLDISMPAGDGFSVAERCRSIPGLACIPVIFLTALEDPELEQRANELGASSFITKPHDGDELLTAIESALAESKKTALKSH